MRAFALCADINGIHLFPQAVKGKPHSDFSKVIDAMEGAKVIYDNAEHKQNAAYFHQGFNYGDFGNMNNRIPNYREYRDQNLLSLICGSHGVINYNWRADIYPELAIGMPALTKELTYLSEVFLSPDSKLAISPVKELRAMSKEFSGNHYFFVCNAQMKDAEINISIPGISKLAKKLNVISEGRSVALNGDSFSEKFYPYEVHVYTTCADNSGLETVSSICARIDKANEEKRKPGNLAFELNEGDSVAVTASSNQIPLRRPDNALWHVVDGVNFKRTDFELNGVWHSKPEDKTPWIEIRFPEQKSIAKVIVYPYKQSLKDYSVQGFVNGNWVDLDKVTGKNDECLTHKFAPVTTDRVRLLISAVNGKCAEVSEIEIYGPEK
ncbi:MAG: F5/8 type C domain protein [Syntrophorhabdus sp. PtaU1.Bin153]|nr:MAG: F5/8 type C domain protein [Syntrophorhabdus sp. PtaU1.Bin153]